ncbi:hypothetical protein BOTBODRAFT_217801 [Botryobasidium botryosum FD-172 SS1]|uniref:Uncharacterized protein n=1 Tax=Botryobasidium botryosum (strain FD-172 SS1) TaxID=930990 RepID=A0A067NCU7_BOTB1|nr:hypothetical protein BOTBODRAFT_217801 [Botryobasidium botryosum FD-172 SS1]
MATNTIFSRRFPLADAMFPPLTEGYMKELDARRSAWVNSMKYYEERLYSMLHERDRLILRYFHASPFVPGYLSDNRIAFRDNPGSFENLAQLDTQFYADLRAWQRARYVLREPNLLSYSRVSLILFPKRLHLLRKQSRREMPHGGNRNHHPPRTLCRRRSNHGRHPEPRHPTRVRTGPHETRRSRADPRSKYFHRRPQF